MVGIDKHLQNTESEIEVHLLRALYPELGHDFQEDLRSQHVIDYYDMPLTIPDFAFPKDKIAIYCDGYEFHADRGSFQKDRQQSRDLQLQGWSVLRFTGSEILNDTDSVVSTIQQAVKQKTLQKANRHSFGHVRRRWKDGKEKLAGRLWGLIAGILIAAVVSMILFEYFFPTLFFELF